MLGRWRWQWDLRMKIELIRQGRCLECGGKKDLRGIVNHARVTRFCLKCLTELASQIEQQLSEKPDG